VFGGLPHHGFDLLAIGNVAMNFEDSGAGTAKFLVGARQFFAIAGADHDPATMGRKFACHRETKAPRAACNENGFACQVGAGPQPPGQG
jgi:hypothetical protein